jgi:hypothetical protein
MASASPLRPDLVPALFAPDKTAARRFVEFFTRQHPQP